LSFSVDKLPPAALVSIATKANGRLKIGKRTNDQARRESTTVSQPENTPPIKAIATTLAPLLQTCATYKPLSRPLNTQTGRSCASAPATCAANQALTAAIKPMAPMTGCTKVSAASSNPAFQDGTRAIQA
jgi:hypothetical protein